MLAEIQSKLNISTSSLLKHRSGSKIHFITGLDNTPEHIKYRYTATFNKELTVNQIILEFVTQIEGEYVSFKELFVFKPEYLDSYDSCVLEHIKLFLDLIHIGSDALVVV